MYLDTKSLVQVPAYQAGAGFMPGPDVKVENGTDYFVRIGNDWKSISSTDWVVGTDNNTGILLSNVSFTAQFTLVVAAPVGSVPVVDLT